LPYPDDIRGYFIDRLASGENRSKLQVEGGALKAENTQLNADNTKQKQRLEELEAEVGRLRALAVRKIQCVHRPSQANMNGDVYF
jgi:hypothetical protein